MHIRLKNSIDSTSDMRRGVGGGGEGVFEPWHLIQGFKLFECLYIKAVTIFVSIFLSIFYLCLLVPCMLATFAQELNTTVRTSMTVKDLCHLFQFRREEVQAETLSFFVSMILSVSNIFALLTRITVD